MRREQKEAIVPLDYEQVNERQPDGAMFLCVYLMAVGLGAVMGWTSCYLVYVL